ELYHLVPRMGPTGLATVASRVGDHHAVSGESRGSPSGGGGPRAYRLEVSAEPGADGSWVRLSGRERIPRAPPGGERRRAPPRQAARALPDPGPAHGPGTAAHRLDARARGDPCPQSPRTRGRNTAGRAECRRPGRA